MPAVMAKGVEVVRLLDPNAGPVSADPSRLQQVIWNLVSNAVKFSPKGSKVFVRVQRVDSSVELAVIDQGQGISAEFLPHIFERFRQEDASATRSHGGLGLGLAIVKHLVELHGGTVRAESRGADQGIGIPHSTSPSRRFINAGDFAFSTSDPRKVEHCCPTISLPGISPASKSWLWTMISIPGIS